MTKQSMLESICETIAMSESYSAHELNIDPIAICLYYGSLSYSYSTMYSNLVDIVYKIKEEHPIETLIDCDAVCRFNDDAQCIRKYFKNKLTLKALNGDNISDYWKAVAEVLTSPTKITVNSIGLIIKMPTFFKEDNEYKQLSCTYISAEASGSYEVNEVSLDYVKTIIKSRKNNKCDQFIFKDRTNRLYKISTVDHTATVLLNSVVNRTITFHNATVYPLRLSDVSDFLILEIMNFEKISIKD